MNQGHNLARFIIPASKERCLPVPERGVPRRGELMPSRDKSYKGYSLPRCACKWLFHSQTNNQFVHTCCLIMEKKTTCMYETTLYMPHVPGQPPTHHPMQVPMGNQYRVSPDSHLTTRSLCDIYLIVSCLFGQQNFSGSHRGSLTPSDIFRAFTDGYAV